MRSSRTFMILALVVGGLVGLLFGGAGCGGRSCTRTTDCGGHLVCNDVGACVDAPVKSGDGDGGSSDGDGGSDSSAADGGT
jgi:hypothetical protein